MHPLAHLRCRSVLALAATRVWHKFTMCGHCAMSRCSWQVAGCDFQWLSSVLSQPCDPHAFMHVHLASQPMSRAPPTSHALSSSILGVSDVKVWVLESCIGDSIWWEWRYWHDVLQLPEAWVKNQWQQGSFQAIAEDFDLAADAFVQASVFGAGNGLLVRSKGLLALLESVFSRPGPAPPSRRADARNKISCISLACELALSNKPQIEIMGHVCTVPGNAVLQGLDQIWHGEPDFLEWWASLASDLGLPSFERATLFSLWKYARRLSSPPKLKAPSRLVTWASAAVVGISQLVAFGVELHAASQCARGILSAPKPLHGPKLRPLGGDCGF